jgi:hypothetical protein
MLRTFSAIAIGATVLGLTALPALPASAAPASHPKVHAYTVPSVTGIKAWGTYSFSGGKAHITVCVKETAPSTAFGLAVGTAFNAAITKNQSVHTEVIGAGKQKCTSMVTKYTAHFWVAASSGTTGGQLHNGKAHKVY